MNEVLNSVPATAVTLVGHLITFGLGWAARLWWTRNPETVADLAEKVAKAMDESQIVALISDGKDAFSSAVAKAASKLDKL